MGKAGRKKGKRQTYLRVPSTGRRAGPLPPDVTDMLDQQRRKFIEKFGREPREEDPIFFDPNADTPQPITLGYQDEREILAAMTQAGVDPPLIYAYQKTGRLVTEENMRFLTEDELQEWFAAVEEGRRLLKPQ